MPRTAPPHRPAFRTLALLACFIPLALLVRGRIGVHAQSAGDTLHITVAGRDVALWKPSGVAPPNGFPVILFSHGYTGCNTQSVFLMMALARAGYLVLAPNHKDATCGSAKGSWYPGKMLSERPQEPFRDVSAWNDTTYKDRYDDIESVLNAALQGKSFQGVPVDPSRVGIAGHSLGGYTALAVAGAWPTWKDRRIKAVLALSPHCSPFVAKGDLQHLDVPVMYQGGTIDMGETPVVKRAGGAYDLSSAPRYFVELEGAGHFAWTDLNPRFQSVIDEYSVAFFDRYLKPHTPPDQLVRLMTKPLPPSVSEVRADPK